MTLRASSREQAWAIVLWAFLGACIWTGCGPGRTLSLINGYDCEVGDSFTMIMHPDYVDSFSQVISDVGDLDLVGDIVFGTRVDWKTGANTGYFIIDTLTHDVLLINDYQEWIATLDGMGITERNIRWPGVFFHGFGFRHLFLSILVVVLPTLLIFFGIRSLARNERQARRQKWERL